MHASEACTKTNTQIFDSQIALAVRIVRILSGYITDNQSNRLLLVYTSA